MHSNNNNNNNSSYCDPRLISEFTLTYPMEEKMSIRVTQIASVQKNDGRRAAILSTLT